MMTGRGSPMLNLRKSKIGKKKPSPKVCVEKSRASWNPGLEKALVDLLHEHNTPEHRGQNGWTHESWNLMAKKFHEKHQYANLTKSQIQEKEKELKRDYRILKDARKQSGASWNDQRCMIVAEPAVWANIITSYPRAKKFRNKPFPLFDALGELHDGNTADGIHNFTSIEPSQITTSTEADTIDVEASNTETDLQETSAYDDGQASMTRDREVEANMQRNAASTTTRNEDQEPKRRRQTADLSGIMESFLEFRAKKAEEEAARLARERAESSHVDDFSIKRCIDVLNTMEVTRQEKVKAYGVFKTIENRQIFINTDPVSALMWLRSEMK